MENFDAIIIGASVAGSSAAAHLASQGHHVLVIDQSVFPRDRLSTHFLWPRGVSYLNRLGVAGEILKKTPNYRRMNIYIEGVKLSGSIPLDDIRRRFLKVHNDCHHATDIYCGPRRLLLDYELLKAAELAGAEIRQNVKFSSLLTENGAVTGISATTGNGNTFQAKAKIVIGADGRHSSFADAVQAEVYDRREDSTFAFFGYYSGLKKEELTISNRGRLGSAIFPTSDGTHMALAYGPASWWKDFSRHAENNFFKTFDFCDEETAALIREGKREKSFKGCEKMVAFQRKSIGPGWALIGDAGSFKDQVTAMGMTHALRDSELISGYLGRALSGLMSVNKALEEYEHARANDYENYFNFVCDVAKLPIRSEDDIQHITNISQSQEDTDHFLSQFGDTRPLNESQGTGDKAGAVTKVAGYDVQRDGYLYSLYG